jgi:hypothetical protein
MSKAKGYIRSPSHVVGLGHPDHLTALPVPTSGEVALGPVVDQGKLGSCTGNSTAVAIQAKMPKINGAWAPLPSRLWLYFGARALEDSIDQDAGAMISDIFGWAAKMGYPPETAWAYPDVNADEATQLAKCVAMPDWRAFQLAADQKVIKGAYRLASTGQARVDDVKRAIAAGYPIVWGTSLDQAFEDLLPTHVWPGVRGASIGGHAMVLHRFDGDIFWSRSSWTADFADNGSARVSAEAVASPDADDFWLVEVVDGYSSSEAA